MIGGIRAGVLAVDKPEGPTSHDVVVAARRALGERVVGHTGTLDPFASGLLLLCVGRATRLAQFLSLLDKTYEATARLGVATDTEDREGRVVSTSEAWQDITRAALDRACADLRGEILQRPSSFSAKKVDGKPAYRRARDGEEVTLGARPVKVHELVVLDFASPDVHFRVRCSSGTYVRALARDLGEALTVGAHLTRLRRTAVGSFDVAAALRIDDLTDPSKVSGAWIEPLDAVSHLPRVDVDSRAAEELAHGRAIDVEGIGDGEPVVAACRGALVAVGEVRRASFLPRKVFTGA